ncbi:MAG: hypothetical protein GEU90_04030 [Gemmatimonas sp.]|nr:hypothetical protein [Gemmatimonas sp.]
MPYLTEAEARELAERALAMSQADEARVNISSGLDGNTRFAVNQISTSGETRNATVSLTSAFGTRLGSATTNAFDDDSLRRAVETSERIARLAPEDPEYMGQLEPQTYPAEGQRWFETTASLEAEGRAEAVRSMTREAQARGFVSTGFLPMRARSEAVANSHGLFAYTRSTGVALSTTVRTPDGTGSGWAGTSQHDWSAVDAAQLAERALRKAELSQNPQPIDPGPWTVILEPEAVGSLVGFTFGQLQARSAAEGRSYFARPDEGTRIGERIVDNASPSIRIRPIQGS